jgi:hypothetical protein
VFHCGQRSQGCLRSPPHIPAVPHSAGPPQTPTSGPVVFWLLLEHPPPPLTPSAMTPWGHGGPHTTLDWVGHLCWTPPTQPCSSRSDPKSPPP